jgi:hypothetical protein
VGFVAAGSLSTRSGAVRALGADSDVSRARQRQAADAGDRRQIEGAVTRLRTSREAETPMEPP